MIEREGVDPMTRRSANLLRAAVTVALVVLLLRLVDFRQVWRLLAGAKPGLVLLGVALNLCDRALMFGKWFPLVRARLPATPVAPAARVYFASGLAQYLLPVTVGADALRAAAVGRSQQAVAEVGASIVAERLLGLLASGVLCAVAFAVAMQQKLPLGVLAPWVVGAIGVGALLLVFPFSRLGIGIMRRASEELPESGWVRFLRRLAQGFVAYRTRPKLLLRVGLLSVLEQCIPILTMAIVARALGIRVPFSALIVTMPLALFVGRLPISLGGIGVGEAAIVYLLGLFSVSTSNALAMAVLNRALEVPVMALPGLLLWRDLVQAPARAEATRMRIAIMMRAIDQDSGLRSYVEGLVDEMLRIDGWNQYILLYRTDRSLGRFSGIPNAKERLIRAPHKFLWDQVAVPWVAWRERADVIFNPKFSVPLVSPCPVAMGIQPPDWFSWPQHYERFDAWYMRTMLPFYIRKCAHLFPMSQFNLDETKKYVSRRYDNATVTYTAPARHIRRIEDAGARDAFRRKYRLPERLILGLARVGHVGLDSSQSFYEGKNVDATVKAFIRCRDQISHDLVLTGFRVKEYLEYKGFRGRDFDRIHIVGFLPYEEIPYVYSVADVVIIPSFYEGTSITLMEAMACGCPVIASRGGACPEVAGGAALLADPHDPSDFASKIVQVLRDSSLRESMRKQGLERASFFTWERCARLTLEGLEKAVRR
jgi:uncharacterized protein (TIRG00374 family)